MEFIAEFFTSGAVKRAALDRLSFCPHNGIMRTDYLDKSKYSLLYSVMMYDNALALEVSLTTGMRIGDVLKIRPSDIDGRSIHYVAEKTGKDGVAVVPLVLADRLRRNGSDRWCFPHRTDRHKHRTRQAVWKDVKKAAAVLRQIEQLDDRNVAPHSARKTFAVDDAAAHGVAHTQELLQHSSRSVTEIYTESKRLVDEAQLSQLCYRDLSELLSKVNEIDEKVTKIIQLLNSRIVSGCI